jgi:hypothetical protein
MWFFYLASFYEFRKMLDKSSWTSGEKTVYTSPVTWKIF